jgi:HEAT repeat protein
MIGIKTVLVTAAALAAAVIAAGGGRRYAAASNRTSEGGSQKAGSQRRWGVTMEASLTLGGGAGSSQTTVVSGDWVETVSGSSASGYDVACELDHPHVVGKPAAAVDPKDVAALESRLGRRFWITYRPDGAVAQTHYPRDMSDTDRNLLQLLATSTQLVRPSRPLPQWTSTERDGAGAYLANYEQPEPREILKKKLHYVALDGMSGGGSGLRLVIDASEARFALDGQGQIEAVHAHEATHFDAKLGTESVGIEIRVEMDRPRTGMATELIGSLERAESQLVSGPVVTQKPSEDELVLRSDTRLMEGVTLKEVLAAVRDGKDDAKTHSRLEAFLRRHPSDISTALAFAREGDGLGLSGAVLGALGAAGTPEAQAALCALSGDANASPVLRKSAMIALVRAKRPTEETMEAFVRLMNGVGDASTQREIFFTAGTMAHNGEETQPALAARLETALADRYSKCSGEACVVLLQALGNVGTSRAMPVLEPALEDADANRRAAAVDALRLIRDPGVDVLIADRITKDPDAKVRAAAIGTVRYRPMGPLVEALSSAIKVDPSDFVRVQAINVVTEHVGESPLIRQALVAAATTDPKPGVRRLAGEVLGTRTEPARP